MPFSRVFCTILLAWTMVAATRPIAADDIYAFRWAADPRIAPDGTRVVFTQVSVNAKHDGYDTALWLVATSGGAPRPLTAGPRDSSPRWSPDGTRLAFVRAIEKDGKPQPAQIWILPMDGGEARQLTTIVKGASAPVWSPDGTRIAFTSTTKPGDSAKKKDDEPSDVRVITRAVYRANGDGYSDFDRPAHIWTTPVQAGPQTATQITSGVFSENAPDWTPDGGRLYFTSNRDSEPYYKAPSGDLYSVPCTGGAAVLALHTDGPMRAVTVSPDGKSVAFVSLVNGDPIRSYSQPDLWTARLSDPQPRNLTATFDFDIGGGPGGDQGPPRGGGGSSPIWSADGRTLIAVAEQHGAANLQRVNTETGKLEPLTTGNHAIYAYSATPDVSRLVVAISTPTNIGDLYLLDAATKALRRLTNINEKLFSQLKLTEPEMIWYDSFDGKKIQAWVQRPPDFNPSSKYPVILNIHGGPHAAYGYVFDHEFQWMAAKGYVVLYPNPRGSTSYGQDFGNIIQYAYPGDDYKDLMAGVDELLRRGWADPARLAVTGGSGGGVLTNWTIGHTDRFKAAVSQRSIADWTDFWYTADFVLFQPTWFRGAPWQQEADFKARSPITYIEKIKTPTMFIEGEADFRTPPGAGGEQMFRALKFRHIPTAMVQFPGESHELSRSGKPIHRVERLQHIVAWFDKFVLGQDIKTYDLPVDEKMIPTATLVILTGQRAGASYALGMDEVQVGGEACIRWEDGRHVVHNHSGPSLPLKPGDEILIGGDRFVYQPAIPADERHILLRATTLLYLFRSWEQMRGDAAARIVAGHIISIIADLLGHAGPLTGEIFDSHESPPAGDSVTLPLFIQGKLDATVVLHLPPSDHYIDTLSSIASLASIALESARETATLRNEVALLAEQVFTGGIVGDSAPVRRLLQMIERVAARESTVLILGESGTGKELVARAIHQRSARQSRSFVPINCAAITDTLLESELFGHEKGAFTGAVAQKKGRLEMAQGGTVFLDEVGELAPGLQAKLLRVLQEREFVRVGSTQAVKLDVRVLAATNRDLAADVRSGAFREDLYHRLNVIALRTPPLRERKEDIPALARHFLARICEQCRRKMAGFSPEAEQALLAYDWPGNIRELENAIERAVVLAETATVLPEDLPDAISETVATAGSGTYQQSVGEAKRDSIVRAYEQAGGDYKAAARLLSIHPNYLLRLVRNLGLKEEIGRRARP